MNLVPETGSKGILQENGFLERASKEEQNGLRASSHIKDESVQILGSDGGPAEAHIILSWIGNYPFDLALSNPFHQCPREAGLFAPLEPVPPASSFSRYPCAILRLVMSLSLIIDSFGALPDASDIRPEAPFLVSPAAFPAKRPLGVVSAAQLFQLVLLFGSVPLCRFALEKGPLKRDLTGTFLFDMIYWKRHFSHRLQTSS
jgi:hypothetical protein